MKVLSMIQPWASLVVMGAKTFEVRSWKTKHRGPLLIHASARKPSKREQLFFEQAAYFNRYIHRMEELPYGALIGQAKLADIYPTEWLVPNLGLFPNLPVQQELAFDDYSPNRFAWKLEDAHALKYYLPMKGSLGLWEYNGLF